MQTGVVFNEAIQRYASKDSDVENYTMINIDKMVNKMYTEFIRRRDAAERGEINAYEPYFAIVNNISDIIKIQKNILISGDDNVESAERTVDNTEIRVNRNLVGMVGATSFGRSSAVTPKTTTENKCICDAIKTLCDEGPKYSIFFNFTIKNDEMATLSGCVKKSANVVIYNNFNNQMNPYGGISIATTKRMLGKIRKANGINETLALGVIDEELYKFRPVIY